VPCNTFLLESAGPVEQFACRESVQPFNERVRPELIEPVGKELLFTAKAWNASVVTAGVKVAE
jgi:hypothetical protein